jgi:hypothetical protein
MTTELLDELIARLPALRDQGVTHISVDPTSGAVSMLIAPKPVDVQAAKDGPRLATQEEASELGIQPGSPMPLSFRERRTSAAPAVR